MAIYRCHSVRLKDISSVSFKLTRIFKSWYGLFMISSMPQIFPTLSTCQWFCFQVLSICCYLAVKSSFILMKCMILFKWLMIQGECYFRFFILSLHGMLSEMASIEPVIIWNLGRLLYIQQVLHWLAYGFMSSFSNQVQVCLFWL